VKAKAFCLAWLLLPALVSAHTRSESYSEWTLSERAVTLRLTIAVTEVTRLPEYGDGLHSVSSVFLDHVRRNVSIASASGPCEPTETRTLRGAPGFVRVELDYDCQGPPQSAVYRVLFDAAPSHVHYARMFRNGELTAEALLTDANDKWSFPTDTAASGGNTLSAFVRLGMEHIAGGADHIAFLLGMLLIAGSFRGALIAVTGFTLGHSISLAAAVIGAVSADSSLVEAFIGFTVALVATEYFVMHRSDALPVANGMAALALATAVAAVALGNAAAPSLVAHAGMALFAWCYLMLTRHGRFERNATPILFVVTGIFGLIHGLGFAGFLLDSGALGESLVTPLFGFNLGVELGQLLIVAAALLATRLLAQRLPAAAGAFTAAALCGIGVYWYVLRSAA